MILNLSFAARSGKSRRGRKRSHFNNVILQPPVNDTTKRLALEAPAKERLLDFMASIPPEEHIHFSKMDIANGYWRMIVQPEAQ